MDTSSWALRPRHLRNALPIIALLAMTTGAVLPAGAQEPERGETVRDRARPDYDAAGIRSGGLLIFPSVEVRLRHEDNIYRTDGGETEDIVTSVRPRIDVASQWSNHELVVSAGTDTDFFANEDDENSTDWFLSADGRVDIARDANVYVGLSAQGLHEDRGDPNAPRASREPISYSRQDVRLGGFYRFNRLSLTLEGNIRQFDFDNGIDRNGNRIVQRGRDREENEVMARAGYAAAPGYEAFVRVTRYNRRYEHHGTTPPDRDSDGWELVVGTALDLGGIVFGEVFAGHRSQDYDDASLPTIDGFTLGGTVNWNVTPLTTVNGSVQRTVEESVFAGASGFLSTTVSLGVDHELQRNLILNAVLSLTRNDYGGITREDDLFGVEIGATYFVNRNLRADFGYRYQSRDSTTPGEDFDGNVVHMTIRLQY